MNTNNPFSPEWAQAIRRNNPDPYTWGERIRMNNPWPTFPVLLNRYAEDWFRVITKNNP